MKKIIAICWSPIFILLFVAIYRPFFFTASTVVKRSLQPGITAAIASPASMSISGGTMTVSALPDCVGVGDIVEFDSTGASGTVNNNAVIMGRTSSTSYTVARFNGSSSATCAAATNAKIYRCYTSLANWESGIENTGMTAAIRNIDPGNFNLDTANRSMWVVCYPGTENNNASVTTIDGWTTSADDSILIYTPCSTNDVGATQRHSGRLTGRCYRITTTTAQTCLAINDDAGTKVTQHVTFDGIQVSTSGTSGGTGIQVKSENATSRFRFANCIFFGPDSVSTILTSVIGIDLFSASLSAGQTTVFNCIIYGWVTNGATINEGGIFLRPTPTAGSCTAISNTIYKCQIGMKRATAGTSFLAVNNIVNRTADGYNGGISNSSDYNISSLAADCPGSPGTNNKNSTTVLFTDAPNGDFSLHSTDTGAKNSGYNSSSDPIGAGLGATFYTPFNYDATYKLRPGSDNAKYDIGALEYLATGSCLIPASSTPPTIFPAKPIMRIRRIWN